MRSSGSLYLLGVEMTRKISQAMKKRRDNIRECGCLVCGNPMCSWHHVIGHGYSAMGMKAPDTMTFGLCHIHHMDLHDNGWGDWEEKHGRTQLEFVDIQNRLLEVMEKIS